VSDDSVPLALPLLRLAAGSSRSRPCIANYASPCCGTWSVSDLRATKRRMWCKTRFSACNGIWLRMEHRKTSAAGCFALRTIRRGIARRAIIGDSANRSTAKWIFWRTTRRRSNGCLRKRSSGVSQPRFGC